MPVHTIIRLGRNVAEAVRKTVEENASDLVVLGWPGYTNTAGRLYGSVIDPIVDNPPADIALVRYREHRPVRSTLVPVAGGPNSRRAVRMATNMASAGENGPVKVMAYDLVLLGDTEEPLFRNLLMGNIATQIARRAKVTVIVVKRRSSSLHSFLRQTVLEPTTGKTAPSPARAEADGPDNG